MVNAQSGWGVSAGIGTSQIRDRDSDGTFEGDSFGYKLNVEYRFSTNFALGVGGFSLGDDDDVVNGIDTTLDVGGADIFARLIFPATERLDIYGRLGGAAYFVDSEPFSFDGLFGDDAFEIGLGFDFAMDETDNLAIRLEGLYFKGSSNESGSLTTVGFSYRF